MRLRKVFLAAPLLLTLAACSSKEEKGEEVTYDQWQETMDVNNSVNCIYNIDYMINNGMKLKIESTEKSSKIKTTMVTEVYGNTLHASVSASIIKVDMLGLVEKDGDDFTITSLTDTIEEAKDNYRTFKYGNKFYYETDNTADWSETIKLDEFVAAKDTFYNFNNYEYDDGVYKQKNDISVNLSGSYVEYSDAKLIFRNARLSTVRCNADVTFGLFDTTYKYSYSYYYQYTYDYKFKQLELVTK